MADDTKFIVTETNKLLKTDYNLISFDSLSPENLLQVLVNVMVRFDAISKYEIRDNEPDDYTRKVMEGLRNIQYRPPHIDPTDPGGFRNSIMHADKKVIYPIFRWIYENTETIRQAAYLAKFLIPINLPSDALSIPDISNLYTEYEMAMEQFKEVHRAHQAAMHEGTKTRELKNDINAIEMETENVKKRIDRAQSRLDKIPQQELFLESAHNLRVERERQKELQSQMDEQKQGLHRATQHHERLQKELQTARLSAQGASPENLMEGILEETQVLEFMVKQKLPQELQAKLAEVQILEEVLNEPGISRDYLFDLQVRVDELNKEVQSMVERRMAERDTQNDTLAPFRQQAAMVARNKEMAAEQLNQATKELREVDEMLQMKQQKLQETVGEVILRGDELKQYVNTLRAKSSVYKQQRAELASLKAEVTDLSLTLENLKSQDPTLSTSLNDTPNDETTGQFVSLGDPLNNESRPDSPIEQRGMAELTRLVEGLTRAVTAARDRVTPLSQQLRPIRERVTDVKDDRDSKKQSYDALKGTLNAELAAIQKEITENETEIKKLESKWQENKSEHERAEILLEKASEELKTLSSNPNGNRTSLKDTLNAQIKEQENLLHRLQEERQYLTTSKEDRIKQQEMWSDLIRLMQVKVKCFHEAENRGIGGTLMVEKNAETFTLQ